MYKTKKRDERVKFCNIESQIKYLAGSFVLLNVHYLQITIENAVINKIAYFL